VVDQSKISEELGGDEAHSRMCDELARHGMSHILDVVPNHMTVTDRANEWWWDVLKNGPESHFAPYFDIDWDPPEDKLHRTLLVPILGDHYGRVLRSGDIKLERENDEVVVRYFEHVLPTAPGSVGETDLQRAQNNPDLLHQLLERQHYRLAFWRSAGQELNYRRFFSISDLAALQMDNPDVFDRVHALVLELVRTGVLEGLRIDHVDGLRDPEGYLTQLRSWAPDAYLVVEKILEPEESLRRDWPIEGTTGYEFLNRVLGLFVDPSAEERFTQIYENFTGENGDLAQLKHDKKMLLMETELAADVERLLELFAGICHGETDLRDFTRVELRDALRETIAWFPVYRTYVSTARHSVDEQDEAYVTRATTLAAEARPELAALLLHLRDLLLLRVEGDSQAEFGLRFQQTTGAVMAKGVEDTVFYLYNRFVALNEVGGDPGTFGTEPRAFHDHMDTAQHEWPLSMLATSTHDTKRSEDVRARLALLSEIPDRWEDAVRRWRATNEVHRSAPAPDRNIEYLLYQTLVGAWPLDVDRALAYVEKAAKEAKAHTSWTAPDRGYEDALRAFVTGILSDERFVSDLRAFAEPLIEPGSINSLAQQLVKLTAPGVPDIYQGTEVWDLSLVDPDNRRPVDFLQRASILDALREADAAAALGRADAGGPKLFVTRRALAVRNALPEAFGSDSSYEPLRAQGSKASHVVSFVRGGRAITVVPRLVLGLAGSWDDTTIQLPDGRWRDELSDREFEGKTKMSELCEQLPVALLVSATGL
jgi:(1->4)-alpha-D-glucan 1-alpha-D-glucosylmutase